MEKIKVFFNETWRPKTCCCGFTLKNGATAIGILQIVWEIIVLCWGLLNADVVEKNIGVSEEHESIVMVSITVHIFLLITMLAVMILGNIKGKRTLMMPYVYVKPCVIILGTLHKFIIAMVQFVSLEFRNGFVTLFISAILIAFEIYCWQIVRYRALELGEVEKHEREANIQSREYESIQISSVLSSVIDQPATICKL